MADQKLTALTGASSAAEQDELYLVTDTATTPQSKKITFDNLQNSFTDISLNSIQFDTTNTTLPVEGQLAYNADDAALKLGLAGGNTQVALGKELVLPRRVKNETGSAIAKGSVVYINGVSGNTPTIAKAIATSDATSAFTIGLAAETINNNSTGWVITNGLITGINLSSFTAGQVVYLSGTVAGEFTSTKPAAPIHYVRVGIITKATASGEMIVVVQNGFEMEELHNVAINAISNKEILVYNSSNSLWENRAVSYIQDGITHNSIGGLTTGDPHTQYAFLNGRSGGQSIVGGTLANTTLRLTGNSATGNTSTNAAIEFYVGNAGQTLGAVIRNNGNFGIGTNAPTYKLDIGGQVRTTSSLFWTNSNNSITHQAYNDNLNLNFYCNEPSGLEYPAIVFSEYWGLIVENGLGNICNISDVSASFVGYIYSDQYLQVGNISTEIVTPADGDMFGGSTNSNYYYDASGRIIYLDGFGTGAGSDLELQFRGARGTNGAATANVSGDDIGTLRFYSFDGTNYDQIAAMLVECQGAQNTGAFRFYTANAGGAIQEEFTILGNGNIGMGVAAPTQNLEVGGRIRMNTWTADGDVAAYRDNATNCIALIASDRRLKKDLEVIPNALDKVKAITGYTYRKIDDEPTAAKKYGVMAQDVLTVAPELTFEFTNEDDPETYYSVHYDKLPALLIQAVKEQQTIIEELMTRIANLEAIK